MDVIVLEGVWLVSNNTVFFCPEGALTQAARPSAAITPCGESIAVADFTMFRGNDEQLDFTITQSSSGVDLTGFTLEFEVRNDDGTILFEKSVGSGITLLTQSGSTVGQGFIVIDSADTSGLANIHHTFVYNFQLKTAAGVRTTVASGLLKIRPVTSVLS